MNIYIISGKECECGDFEGVEVFPNIYDNECHVCGNKFREMEMSEIQLTNFPIFLSLAGNTRKTQNNVGIAAHHLCFAVNRETNMVETAFSTDGQIIYIYSLPNVNILPDIHDLKNYLWFSVHCSDLLKAKASDSFSVDLDGFYIKSKDKHETVNVNFYDECGKAVLRDRVFKLPNYQTVFPKKQDKTDIFYAGINLWANLGVKLKTSIRSKLSFFNNLSASAYGDKLVISGKSTYVNMNIIMQNYSTSGSERWGISEVQSLVLT